MTRTMTVSYSPGSNERIPTPMLRIANRYLTNSGFTVGEKVYVRYSAGSIIINLKNKKI